ncbi:MAG: hypothetical protein P4L99_20545 [Chthoniobacter sp.]|nr:hypothetical protein [Chthoniobacter sp.]
MKNRWHEIIQRHAAGEATAKEAAALQAALREDADVRALYLDYMNLDVALGATADAAAMTESEPAVGSRKMMKADHPNWCERFSWRPLSAAAAGIVCGMFSASVMWAYAMPKLVGGKERVLPLVNGSFEGSKEPEANGTPTQFGVWSGDFSRVVGAEQGVEPRQGQRMLRMERSVSLVSPPGASNRIGDLMQLVDLRPFKEDFASGNAILEVSASCAMASEETEEKFRFSVQVYAYSGTPDELEGNPHEVIQSALASGLRGVRLAGGRKWQKVTTRLLLPAEADFVMVKLLVSRLVPRQSGPVEFTGHYIDDVKLVLTTQAAPGIRRITR